VLRPLTRKRTAPPYERARLAADALRTRVHAVRRADRLDSRSRPHTVAVPAAPRSPLRPSRADRKSGIVPEQETAVAAMDQTGAHPTGSPRPGGGTVLSIFILFVDYPFAGLDPFALALAVGE
jgi:hypothetical protein